MRRRLKLQSRLAAVVRKDAVTRQNVQIAQSVQTAQRSAQSALIALQKSAQSALIVLQKRAARSNFAEFDEFLVNQIKDTVFRDGIFFYVYICKQV